MGRIPWKFTVFILISENGIGGETYAWNVIIPKASFAIQMKLAQQNKLLARIANSNAELEMKKFQREIKNKKYMWVTIDLHEIIIVHDD